MNEEREDWLRFVKESAVDGQSYFIFINDQGDYRLIEADDYLNYPLVEGKRIKEKVRKKGCAGEEITELMHPFFKTGETYPMQVARTGKLNFNGREISFAAVVDQFGVEYILELNSNHVLTDGCQVNCCLEEQRCGHLSFQLVSNQ